MDKSPKRNRDKYNPYYLKSDKKNNVYIVEILREDVSEDIVVDISKEIFEGMDELERDEARIIQQDKRHLVHNMNIKENEEDYLSNEDKLELVFYRKGKDKPKSLEEKVIEKIENEKLYKAINSLSDIHRRRILLHFKHNLSFSQIGEIEGCSKMAVKYSIDKALEELRKYFLKKN